MRNFLLSLPSGVRFSVVSVVVCYIGAGLAGLLGRFDVHLLLALDAVSFWRGAVWKLLSYILLPAGLLDFLLNTVGFVVLAPRLERAWSRAELWSLCLISAAGAGLAHLCLFRSSSVPLLGLAGVNFGLLAAWLKLFGNEQVLCFGQWPMSVRRMVLLVLALSFVLSVAGGGANLRALIVPPGGGLAAWLYLTLRWRRNLAVSSNVKTSERISRLEL